MFREKKEKFYESKNSDIKNNQPIAANNNGATQGKYSDRTAVTVGHSILNGIIQKRLTRKGHLVEVHNF